MLGAASKKLISKKEPEKRLLLSFKNMAGRNRTGRITMRHQGGGAKKLYRIIDFGQEMLNVPGVVEALEYDPYRTCLIALIKYEDGHKRYILAPYNLQVGDKIVCQEFAPTVLGNRLKLKNVPIGTTIYNIELVPGMGGKIARSAGVASQVMAQEGKYANLKMPSGEVRKVLSECLVTIGSFSKAVHRFQQWGKAGISRLKGVRPSVRGSAMNACDHPHGGGKNKQPIGRHPRTAWGKPALGVKTRNRNKWTSKFIVQRRVKKNKK